MTIYAQINGAGLCVGLLDTPGTVNAAHMVEVGSYDMTLLGKVWDGAAFVARVKTEKELAAEELQAIDAATGMTRTMREALIAIAGKTGADVAFLAAKEAAAVAARAKLK